MNPSLANSLDRFTADGIATGGFLRAVLENDFVQVLLRADEENIRELREIALYVHNHVPAIAWGSPEKVSNWIKSRGLSGHPVSQADGAAGDEGPGA